jgi:hypothetical protein
MVPDIAGEQTSERVDIWFFKSSANG